MPATLTDQRLDTNFGQRSLRNAGMSGSKHVGSGAEFDFTVGVALRAGLLAKLKPRNESSPMRAAISDAGAEPGGKDFICVRSHSPMGSAQKSDPAALAG